MDGEEKVTIAGTGDDTTTTVIVTYSDNKIGGITAENVSKVVAAMIGETDLTKLATGGKIVATYEANILTIKYTHNLTEATTSTTWTLGTKA